MLGRSWQELWITLFVVLVVIGIFAAQGTVIALGVMGLVVTSIGRLWNRVSLEEVTYERRLSRQRVFIGEEVDMSIVVTNAKPVPLAWLRTDDLVPEAIEVSDAQMAPSTSPHSHSIRHSTSIAWYERIRWDHRIRCQQRGFYKIGPARLASGDLFGFFDSHRTLQDQDYLLVYPRVVPLEELGIPGARPLGDVKGGITIFQDPSRPSGLREYQRGDPLKIMDWKATARLQQLQVRTFDPSSAITVILAVAIETTAHPWQGYSEVHLERVITAAASVATYATEQDYSVGLFVNGTPVLSDRPMRIPPSRDPSHLNVVLEALASVRPVAVGAMAHHLADHARRFPTGATVVLIAALISPELADTVQVLQAKGFRMVVLYMGDGPCPQMAPGVLVHELQEYFVRMEQARD